MCYFVVSVLISFFSFLYFVISSGLSVVLSLFSYVDMYLFL